MVSTRLGHLSPFASRIGRRVGTRSIRYWVESGHCHVPEVRNKLCGSVVVTLIVKGSKVLAGDPRVFVASGVAWATEEGLPQNKQDDDEAQGNGGKISFAHTTAFDPGLPAVLVYGRLARVSI
jgi:hypothetical protein